MLVKSDESQLTYLAKYYGFWALNELILSVRKSWGRLLIFTLILEKQNQFFFFAFSLKTQGLKIGGTIHLS